MVTTVTGVATSFITFSRASTATRVNSSGLIETVASGAARIDYDPLAKSARGILLEEQRTNLLTYSSAFSNWASYQTTVNSDVSVAPDGTTTADEIVRTAGATDSRQVTVTFSGNGTKSVSIFVKYSTSPSFGLSMYDYTASATRLSAAFVFNSGVPTSGNIGAGSVEAIENFGGGWYRIKLIVPNVVAANNNVLFVVPCDAGSSNGQKTAFWGAQAEDGAFATSYIPTTTATVTRIGDIATVPVSAFPYITTEGTLVVHAATYAPKDYAFGAELGDGTYNNRVSVISGAVGSNSMFVDAAGVRPAFFGVAGVAGANMFYRAAIAYKVNDFASSVNGGNLQTTSSGAVPTGITTLHLGKFGGGGNILNGWIKQITYLPRRLTNAELQARTA